MASPGIWFAVWKEGTELAIRKRARKLRGVIRFGPERLLELPSVRHLKLDLSFSCSQFLLFLLSRQLRFLPPLGIHVIIILEDWILPVECFSLPAKGSFPRYTVAFFLRLPLAHPHLQMIYSSKKGRLDLRLVLNCDERRLVIWHHNAQYRAEKL